MKVELWENGTCPSCKCHLCENGICGGCGIDYSDNNTLNVRIAELVAAMEKLGEERDLTMSSLILANKNAAVYRDDIATITAERDELRERVEALESEICDQDELEVDMEMRAGAESAALEEVARLQGLLRGARAVVDHLDDIMEIPQGAVGALQDALGEEED